MLNVSHFWELILGTVIALAAQLTPAQVAEAEAQAKAFKPPPAN